MVPTVNSSFGDNHSNSSGNHHHHHLHNRNGSNDTKLSHSYEKTSNLSSQSTKVTITSPSSSPSSSSSSSLTSSSSSISASLVGSSSILLTVTTTMSTINQPVLSVENVNYSQNAPLFSFVNSQLTNFFGINDRDVPILIGAAAGALGLLIIILAAILAWYCCQFGLRRQRSAYCLDEENEKWASCSNLGSGIFADNDSVIFTGMENLNKQNVKGHNIKRSLSAQLHMVNPNLTTDSAKSSIIEKRYPHSIETIKTHLKPSDSIRSDEINSIIIYGDKIKSNQINCNNINDNNLITSKNPNYVDGGGGGGIDDEDEDDYNHLDDKYRYNSKSQLYSAVINTPNHANCSYNSDLIVDGSNLKTRSLPWKKISTETEETIKFPNNQTKLNFTKKRANRMRNDSAAAIALNRSGATPTHSPYLTKETDCLVDNDSLIDNEAVVVYDERTVL